MSHPMIIKIYITWNCWKSSIFLFPLHMGQGTGCPVLDARDALSICASLRHDLIDKRQKTIFEIKNLYEKAHYIILFIDRHSDR